MYISVILRLVPGTYTRLIGVSIVCKYKLIRHDEIFQIISVNGYIAVHTAGLNRPLTTLYSCKYRDRNLITQCSRIDFVTAQLSIKVAELMRRTIRAINSNVHINIIAGCTKAVVPK